MGGGSLGKFVGLWCWKGVAPPQQVKGVRTWSPRRRHAGIRDPAWFCGHRLGCEWAAGPGLGHGERVGVGVSGAGREDSMCRVGLTGHQVEWLRGEAGTLCPTAAAVTDATSHWLSLWVRTHTSHHTTHTFIHPHTHPHTIHTLMQFSHPFTPSHNSHSYPHTP